MSTDNRCCGSNACIINDDGECWCGQKWDGEKMCYPKLNTPAPELNKINPDDSSAK
jgi:hypothetical protein